jgi:hypothetical protein
LAGGTTLARTAAARGRLARIAFLLPEGHIRRGQADYIALSLGQLNRREDRPETFVLHDLAWVDVRILVEGRVGKLPPVAVDLDRTVLPLANADFSSPEARECPEWAR